MSTHSLRRHHPPALARCRDLVEPALREAVSRLHPQVGRMAAYTFGWCDPSGDPCRSGGGKGVRPALAVLAAEAVGAPAERAVPGAVAVELVHAFTIVHDDIMDGDERRRDRPTVWKAFGLASAVLLGDGLLALAVDTLARAPDVARTTQHVADALVELVLGQADDLAFETRPWAGPGAVTIEEYTRMAARKTAALTGCATTLGAVLGGAPDPLVTVMAELGRHLGLAFQAVDDLLGIWGDPRVTGKPVFSDLERRKKTLPVLSAVAADNPAARELAALLDAPRPAAPEAIADLADRAGGRSYTRATTRRHLDHALELIGDSRLDPAAAKELRSLTDYLSERAQ